MLKTQLGLELISLLSYTKSGLLTKRGERERTRGKGALAEKVAVQGSGDGRVKQVSNSVQAAASGKDPDSHQSITVWWFLTKEVQGKNSSGGDLNPASSGGSHRLVHTHKKGEQSY